MSTPDPRPRARLRRRLAAVAVAVALPAAAVVVAAWPSEAASIPVANGVYTLASGSSGKCINTSGTMLVQVACSTTTATQLWKATSSGSNFTLVNSGSSQCIDGTAAGVQATQSACGSAATQQWAFTASTAASGKYLVKNASTGLCLANKDGSTAGNNPITAQACSDIAQLQWSFTYVSGSTSPTTGPTTAPGTKPTVAKDGTGTYTTVQAAINAVPASNTKRVVITVKAGTYREVVTVPSNKPYITLQGLGSSASQTTIVYNNSAYSSGTSGSASMFVNGKDFIAENLTINNDLDENSVPSGGQAVALSVSADRASFKNVRVLGDQDTLLLNNSARAYFANCYVEGTVDFIFGGGTAVYNACSIYEKRTTGGPITAGSTDAAKTYGILFYKCTIDGAAKGVTGLGRPWYPNAQVLYRESSMTASVNTAQPWSDMSSNSWKNARFSEYKNTGAGATTNSNRPQMSDSTAANYTPQKYLAGTDGWNPL